ncbi:pentatricopeptide repeat-containing protein At5g09450, mitochondrial [Nicotiana tomentosiformis]|uniref:pentatricopeptide repeat-containing protein At5g09450, mitochondrial n=1 Tax=Nicotiana tomentosiformis TaxID=4098 RepID=UPI00051B5562|nr:pentatricopeptide repeat-containing protein At5g09450, mitochondrial [Nicotiana tomentosiformis]
MAGRSIFATLTRKAGGRERSLFRSFSSTTEVVYEDPSSNCAEEENGETGDDLKSRIFSLRLPKRSATNVLQKWVTDGRQVSISDLRHISKQLRNSRRFKHALEISEWLVYHNQDEALDSDYATRIDLMTKVFGIDSAERYFEGLPTTVKTTETYTALLHSYASLRLTDKAEDLFERMKEANLSLSTITYNEMMTLYMSVGQLEKVPLSVEEMKLQKVAPDLFTYNLWVSSCAAALNIDEVRRILDEISLGSDSGEHWLRYMNLVKIYITSGNLVNSGSNSVVESEKGITQREWISYDFLIILYGALGNKDKLDQIWKSLRMTNQKMTCRNYVCILSSYLMLGHMKEVGEIIDQWKQSAATDFDSSSCNRFLKAYSEVGLEERAAAFQLLLIQKGCDLIDESQ